MPNTRTTPVRVLVVEDDAGDVLMIQEAFAGIGRPRTVDVAGIPVVDFTTSADQADILDSYRGHASAYVTKPVDLDGFSPAIEQIDEFYTEIAALSGGKKHPG